MSRKVQKTIDEIYRCIMEDDTPISGDKLETIKEQLRRFERPKSNSSFVMLGLDGEPTSEPISEPTTEQQQQTASSIPPPPPLPWFGPLGFGPPGFRVSPQPRLPPGNAAARPNMAGLLAGIDNVKLKSAERHGEIIAGVRNKLDPASPSELAAAAVKIAVDKSKRTNPIGDVGSKANKEELENKALLDEYAQTLKIIQRGQFLAKPYGDKLKIATAWKKGESTA